MKSDTKATKKTRPTEELPEETGADPWLEAARRKYEEQNSDGGDRSTWDKIEAGKNTRRFLPLHGSQGWYIEVKKHFRVGPDQTPHICLTPLAGGFTNRGMPIAAKTTCPTCLLFLKELAKVNKKFLRGSDEGKEAFKELASWGKPSSRFFARVYNPKEEDTPIKILEYGEKINGPLVNWFFDSEFPCDFANVKRGRLIRINAKALGQGNLSYEVEKMDNEHAVPKEILAAYKELQPLEEIVGQKPTVEEIEALLLGTESSDDEDEDEASEEGEEASEDEKPNCYGDVDYHDPKDATCRKCPFYEACAAEPEVAAKLARTKKKKPAEEPAPLKTSKKDRLREKAKVSRG